MTWRLIAACLALMLAGSPTAMPVASHRPADVEFSIKPMTGSAARAQVAMALWKTGMVERVDAPTTRNGFYRVYLARPGNLLQMQEVQATLEQQHSVLLVTSLAGWLLPRDKG